MMSGKKNVLCALIYVFFSNKVGGSDVDPCSAAGGIVLWMPDGAACDSRDLVSEYALDGGDYRRASGDEGFVCCIDDYDPNVANENTIICEEVLSALCLADVERKWPSETTLRETSAGSYHDEASFLERVNISWSGNVFSVDTRYQYEGGSIVLDFSFDVSWRARENVSDVTAIMYGGDGAVLIVYSSAVVLAKGTSLISNRCDEKGGTTFSKVLDWSTLIYPCNQESCIFIKVTKFVAKHMYGSNGGWLTVCSELSVLRVKGYTTFISKYAVVAAGGVPIPVTCLVPIFINAIIFLSSIAEGGEAVLIARSETSLDPQDEESYNNLGKGRFIGNEVEVPGNAVVSVTVAAANGDTVFEAIDAAVRRALTFTGATSLDWQTSNESASNIGGGPVIKTIVDPLETENNVLRGRAYNDDFGMFFAEIPSGDRLTGVCSGREKRYTCETNKPKRVPEVWTLESSHNWSSYGNHADSLHTADERSRCVWNETKHYFSNTSADGGEAVFVFEGLIWNETFIPPYMFESAFYRRLKASPDSCSRGYTGPNCMVCDEKYFKGPGFTCTKCSANMWVRMAPVVVAAVVSVLTTFAVLTYLVLTEGDGTSHRIMTRLLRRFPRHSVKTIIIAWQILTQFAELANVTYPEGYQRFLEVVDVLDFDLTWVLAVECIVKVDFHGRLLIATILPILAMLGLSGTYFYVLRRYKGSRGTLEIAQHKHVSVAFCILFIVYARSSTLIFQMFDCDALDGGNDYLRADYSIECNTTRHRYIMIYAGFMFMVYPLGIPAFFAFLLLQNRRALLNEPAHEASLRGKFISDLWKSYKPSRFYYVVIECGRRVVLIGVAIAIENDSATQIAAILMLAFMFTVLEEGLAPYKSKLDAWISRLGHAVVVLSMYLALLLKLDISDDSKDSQRSFGDMLIFFHVLMILTAIAETTLTGFSVNTGQVENPWSRYNECRSQRYRARSHLMIRVCTPGDYRGANTSPTECNTAEARLLIEPVIVPMQPV